MAATIAGVPTALANFGRTVPGIKRSLDIKDIKGSLSRNDLPCLMVVPETKGSGQGVKALAMQGNQLQINYQIKHVLFYALSDVEEFSTAIPKLLAFQDAYFLTLKANPFLTGSASPAYHNNPSVSADICIATFGNTKYHAIEFTHSIRINL